MSATWITQGVAERGIVLLHLSGKNPAYQGTSLGEAEKPSNLDAEGTEDGAGAKTVKEPV